MQIITNIKSHNSQSLDNLNIDNQKKKGEQRNCILKEAKIASREQAEIIGVVSELKDAVVDQLVFSYITYVEKDWKSKIVQSKRKSNNEQSLAHHKRQ